MAHATIEIDGIEYSATVSGERVTLYADGQYAGAGRWHEGAIDGCAADLPDGVYEALDAAIAAAHRRMTLTTLTDEQISHLRGEAARAGDLAQIVVCDRALGGTDDRDDYMTPEPHERASVERALDMTQEEARIECARVIAEAEGT